MKWSTGTTHTGFLRVDLALLRDFLRLPKDVVITGVRADPNNAHSCLLDVDGALPADGELVAEYRFVNTTLPEFVGFRRTPE